MKLEFIRSWGWRRFCCISILRPGQACQFVKRALPGVAALAAGRVAGVERLPFEGTPARILVNPSLLPNAVIKRTGMREVPNGGEPAHTFASPVGYQVKVVPSFGGIGGRVTGAKLRVEFAPGRPSL